MSEVFTRQHIVLNLDLKDKNDYLKYIAKLSMDLGIGKEENGVYQGLVDREKEFETNLGDGIAIPHTKSSSVARPGIIVIKPKNEVQWGGGEEGIKLILSILSPDKQEGNIHLKLLASLSRKLIDEDFKRTLINSSSEEDVFIMVDNALNS